MEFPTTRRLTGVLLAAVLSTELVAQGQFLDLPSGASDAYSVSDDGSVVAGTGSGGAFRWTAAGGTRYLGLAQASWADMSGDGSVVMSNMSGSVSPSGFKEAAFWTQPAGWTGILGLIGNNCSGTLSSGYAMSKDGKVIVGLAWSSCKGRAFRWDAANGMIDLGLLGPQSARANCVSGDGQVVGGWDSATNGVRRAAVWFPVGTTYTEMLIIPPSAANPDGGGETWGMNQSGSVIVGEEYGGDAWRWKNGVFESLGTVPGFQPRESGSALATNADGSMIVGNSGSVLTRFTTFMWTEEDGLQLMTDYLADQGITIPSGTDMEWLMDISPSGYHIVGRRGGFPRRAFWIELPAGVRYGVRKGGANTMRLAGTGSTALGGTLTVTTDQLPSANPLTSTLIGLGSTDLPLFGGTLLVDLSLPHLAASLPAAAGSASFSLTIPNDPAIVGASLYMQTVVVAPSVTGGMAFSNGIKSKIVD